MPTNANAQRPPPPSPPHPTVGFTAHHHHHRNQRPTATEPPLDHPACAIKALRAVRGRVGGPGAIFATVFKIWARGRRNYAEEWRRRHDGKHFACGPGRSAEAVVWRQAVVAETALASNMSAATVLEDMRKLYGKFDLDLHAKKAEETDFIPIIARLCVNTYKGPRVLRMGQMISGALFAKLGLLAGCIFADVFVLVYCARVFTKVVANFPAVVFNFTSMTSGRVATGKGAKLGKSCPKQSAP